MGSNYLSLPLPVIQAWVVVMGGMSYQVLEGGSLTLAKTVWRSFWKQPRTPCNDVTHQSCHPDSTVAGDGRGHLGWAFLKATT